MLLNMCVTLTVLFILAYYIADVLYQWVSYINKPKVLDIRNIVQTVLILLATLALLIHIWSS